MAERIEVGASVTVDSSCDYNTYIVVGEIYWRNHRNLFLLNPKTGKLPYQDGVNEHNCRRV